MIKKAVVLGAGSWGTALACVLAWRGIATTLWCREESLADEINQTHRHPIRFPEYDLPHTLQASTDLSHLEEADLILWVLPSSVIREFSLRLNSSIRLKKGSILLSCSKGIEAQTGKRMSEILEEVFPEHPVAVLSGPNHAEEIMDRLPAAAVLGCTDEMIADKLQDTFALPWFRCYTNPDVIGVEWGGASKNIYALAAGTAAGLGLGDNARAALVTRGLAEMVRLGTAFGARPETFAGLSGMGDLVVTCYSQHSRNQRAGHALGTGKSLQEVFRDLNEVAEGIPNTLNIYQVAKKAGIRTPLIDAVYQILYENKPANQALADLLSRTPRSEVDP